MSKKSHVSLLPGEKKWPQRVLVFFASFFPARGDRPGDIIRKIVILILIAIVIVCAVIIGLYYYNSYQNQLANQRLAQEVSSTVSNSSSSYPAGMQSSFYSLYDQNTDIRGLLVIPKTNINNVVVQTTNNDYYLHYNFDKTWSASGDATLFLDYRDIITPSSTSKNLIIYGHNMKDGQMFHDLRYFQDDDIYKTSSLITFNTIYGDSQWKVFAAFYANTLPSQGYVFNYLITDFSTDTAFSNYIKEVQARSLFNTSVDVQPGDTLLTLSTCAYNIDEERFVVMARKVRDGESTDIGAVTKNTDALDPTVPMK